MTVRARWTRILMCSLSGSFLVGTLAFADHHGGEAEVQAAAEAADAAVTEATAASDAAAEATEAEVEATAATEEVQAEEGGSVAADEAAEQTEEAVEAVRPKCSHPHWNYCEAAGKCVLAWRCSAGTFPWPADNCECCARTGLAGTNIRCVQCLPKNCVFPQNCTDPGAALECLRASARRNALIRFTRPGSSASLDDPRART